MDLPSPQASPTSRTLMNMGANHLALRPPALGRTASLPHTPNPFFRNYHCVSPPLSDVPSPTMTPKVRPGASRPDHLVRGPIDIMIGLEKKREKRKEKYWRQHGRKAAREQAERKPVPGVGAERMRELGLERAERNRAYNFPQPAQLVISL